MRVVTGALSMASIVSGRPGPVPGAGGNCGDAGCAETADSTPQTKAMPKALLTPIALLRKRFTPPPVYSLFQLSAFSNGHCRIVRAQMRNAAVPKTISASPQILAEPVCQKSHAHPKIVSTAGKG